MQARARLGLLLAICLAIFALAGCSTKQQNAVKTWDPKLAAAYLDQREADWMQWPVAARDHETFCVSCHTNLSYALARPVLRKALAEDAISPTEKRLLDDIGKRVRLWNEVGPYYTDAQYKDNGKATESRGTESVLNALVLASYDAPTGHLSEITRSAFANMWAQQENQGADKGAWHWLQFGMEPWEAQDSQYYGAALAAVAVGIAPENYRSTPEVQNQLGMLRDYLNRESGAQSTINRVVLLWASTKLPGLLEPAKQKAITDELLKQQQSDGGWELSPLAWPGGWSLHSLVRTRLRSDGSSQDRSSDAYATGLIVFVLQQTGMPADEPHLEKGMSWLRNSQNSQDGSWPSLSLNQRRNPYSTVGHFMRDAATAYAVLALSSKKQDALATRASSRH
jgi:squalene-hopene/tetraprenyl-beta-curcumene cyclase